MDNLHDLLVLTWLYTLPSWEKHSEVESEGIVFEGIDGPLLPVALPSDSSEGLWPCLCSVAFRNFYILV